jgi:hypothetical protein
MKSSLPHEMAHFQHLSHRTSKIQISKLKFHKNPRIQTQKNQGTFLIIGIWSFSEICNLNFGILL